MTPSDFSSTDSESQWERFCELLWHDSSLGIWLDISRMHTTRADFDRLKPAFKKAIQAMQALEAGSYANKDENRQVGHYWLRRPEIAPSKEISNQINSEIDKVNTFSIPLGMLQVQLDHYSWPKKYFVHQIV